MTAVGPACRAGLFGMNSNVPPGRRDLREIFTVSSKELQQREIHFSGRVQGVGFRYTTRSLAAGCRITGFVRNLPDGRVQLVMEGTADEMNRFLVELHKEMGQYIFDQTEIVRPASHKFQGFEIRF
jgi:acylphosphatase